MNGACHVADVEYFFQLRFGDIIHSLAVVSMFSLPDEELLEESHHAVYIFLCSKCAQQRGSPGFT
jgi:hypothetical protein